jgi:hypothetical protein
MADIFGYTHSGKSVGQVASADFAAVTVGKLGALVQSVDVGYAQKVEEIASVGDSQIYYVPGRPSGNLSISKLVGVGKFFEGWQTGACGVIDLATVSLTGGKGGSGCALRGTGSLRFDGGVVESMTVKLGTQSQTISESISVKVSSVSSS